MRYDNNNNIRKSRDQKFYEFFIILQKEYIVAELRKKIYLDVAGRAKSEEIMEGKKKKIFDIAMKGLFKTIFSDMKVGVKSLYDEQLRIRLYKEVYGDGYPNFIYRDENQRVRLGVKDKKCYYMLGSEVKTVDGCIGSLQAIDFKREVCWVKIGWQITEYSLGQVKRIF